VSRTRQWWWLPIIGCLIATGTVGAGATAGQIFLDSEYTGRFALVKYVTSESKEYLALRDARIDELSAVWLSGCAAADAIITGVLVWKFRTIKTSFVNTQECVARALRCNSYADRLQPPPSPLHRRCAERVDHDRHDVHPMPRIYAPRY
jgi:hypothetical protein